MRVYREQCATSMRLKALRDVLETRGVHQRRLTSYKATQSDFESML